MNTRKELVGELRAERFDITEEGIFFPRLGIQASGEYFDRINGGQWSGSNPNLQPETSESKTIGLVYSPKFVQGLTTSLDWWQIRIDDTVVSDSPNSILNDCYVNLIESRCAMFKRDPAQGNIVSDLTYGTRNAGYPPGTW